MKDCRLIRRKRREYMSIGKDVLMQYVEMKEEIKDIEKSIEKLEKYREKIRKEGTVKDSVTGGYGGIQHFVVEGIPFPEYTKINRLLDGRERRLNERRIRLLELQNEVEEYIDSIDDSRIRRLITLRFIDDLSWIKVACRMGKNHTADGCRMALERFLAKN